MQVEILPAAPISNCQVVSKQHDGLLNRTVLVRVQPWQPVYRVLCQQRMAWFGTRRVLAHGHQGANPATLTISDGWQSSNAPVPKTE